MKKYRFVLFPLATGFIIVATTVLFVLPKLKIIVEIKQSMKNDKEKLSRLTDKVNLLEGLDEYELGRRVAVSEAALPSKKAVAKLLTATSFLAEETGASLVDFNISPGEVLPEKSEAVTFEATFKGPRDEIEKVLRRANLVAPVIRVLSFNFEASRTILEMMIYFSPLPKTLGRVDTPLPKISKEEEKIYEKIAQLESFEKRLPPVATGKDNLFSEF